MPKINRKHIGIAAAVIVLIIIIASIRNCGSSVEYEYGYEKVSVGLVEKTVAATGVLDIHEKQPVLSKIGGIIASVKVNPEEKISRGQLLAAIDTTDIDQSLLRLNTRLESSRLALVAAERRYKGKRDMFAEKLISVKDLEQSELEYKTALNDHKLIQIEYNETAAKKKNASIVSPINGVVVESMIGTAKQFTSGQGVGPNSTVFFVAPTLKRMVLTLDIDESDIGSISKGQKVSFAVSAFPNKRFSGEINYVSMNPINKGSLVAYQATAMCDNSELMLKPGMTATATVTADRKENVLRISNQAFIVSPEFEDDGQNFGGTAVWKKSLNPLSEKPADKVEIKTGLAGDMYTEIIDNLKEGDEILVKLRQSNER